MSVFPIPGTKYNLRGQQIAFRGVPAGQIGQVQVVGSVTGAHTGHIAADSDGDGGSFISEEPFAAGETVSVTTGLNVIGGQSGKFSFSIAHTLNLIPYGKLPLVDAGSNGVQHFGSRPDLQPAALTVTKDSAPASNGDIFIAPQFGPAQDGPMIIDPHGKLIWFKPYPVAENTLVTDFRLQTLFGQPVLTWWEGNTNAGHGRGVGVIYNRAYQQTATVRAANGLDMGLHEFLITNDGDAYINASSRVRLPGVGKPAVDSVVQEIDIKSGLVLFEWHALDHVALSESDVTPKTPGFNFDPFHTNSVGLDHQGNLLISMRNTSAVYDINHTTGAINWRLGGKRSTFKMGPGTTPAFQHAAIMQLDGTITLFDDGAGPPTVHPHSRGIRISLNVARKIASLVREYDHAPQISSNFEGNLQSLPGGDVFLGWGQQPYISEDTSAGQQDFDAHFNVPTSTYRAFRFPWSAQPPTLPDLAVAPASDGSTTAYASWNGATDVTSWRVLNGPAPSALTPVGGTAERGFETAISVHSAGAYFAVQALGSAGQVLASSNAVAEPPHVAIYGRSAFVNSGGFAGVPVSCFVTHPCQISTTISVGRTVIARTGKENLGQGQGGLLYFSLSATGRTMLARAPGHRLAVQVTARDASGAAANASLQLIPFSTRGSGPHRSAIQSDTFKLVGETDFVSSSGVGGILTACLGSVPCHVLATLSAGGRVIARTGYEFLGANELGYVIFSLTPAGRTMLAHAPGNLLATQVKLSSGRASASADIALARFS